MFRTQIELLLSTEVDRAAAKERWLKLMKDRSGDAGAVRDAHLALDEQFEQAMTAVIEALRQIQADNMTQFELLSLSPEQLSALRRHLSEYGLPMLLTNEPPTTFQDVVSQWLIAASALEAAQRIDELRVACYEQPAEVLFKVLDSEQWKDAKAYQRARATFDALLRRHGATGSVDERLGLTLDNARRWRARTDHLLELLADWIRRLRDGGMLNDELGELDIAARRAVTARMEQGLARPVKPVTQAQPR